MLHFVEGNMFDRIVDVRINTVNCVGVMGIGVALAFKQMYPDMFLDYKKACADGLVRPGALHVWKTPGETPCTIVNFPTKRHWRQPSEYEDVEIGLHTLRQFLLPLGHVQVTLPALGCGHGGLDWERVKRRIVDNLSDIDAEIWCYSPQDSRRPL